MEHEAPREPRAVALSEEEPTKARGRGQRGSVGLARAALNCPHTPSWGVDFHDSIRRTGVWLVPGERTAN
jgi:hypothetical protein